MRYAIDTFDSTSTYCRSANSLLLRYIAYVTRPGIRQQNITRKEACTKRRRPGATASSDGGTSAYPKTDGGETAGDADGVPQRLPSAGTSVVAEAPPPLAEDVELVFHPHPEQLNRVKLHGRLCFALELESWRCNLNVRRHIRHCLIIYD